MLATKVTKRQVTQHPAFATALLTARIQTIGLNQMIEVSSRFQGRERLIVKSDGFGIISVDLILYDYRKLVVGYGGAFVAATRFYHGTGATVVNSEFAPAANKAWRDMVESSFGL